MFQNDEGGRLVEVVIKPTGKNLAVLAADAIERLLVEKPHAALGLATGSSPLAVDDELVRRYDAG